MESTRWGRFLGGATEVGGSLAFGLLTPVLLPAKCVAGFTSVAKGESYADGADRFVDSVTEPIDRFAEAARDFGDAHADELTENAKFVGKQVLGGLISAGSGKLFGDAMGRRPAT